MNANPDGSTRKHGEQDERNVPGSPPREAGDSRTNICI